jgi:hypothetical protein
MAITDDTTLQEIADMFEEELGATTGTSIAPGTIAPVGITTAAGKKKLSWPEIVKRLFEGEGLAEGELLPEVVGGASDFYRAGVTSGLLPGGASTFTQAPFTGGFANRMGVAAGVIPSVSQPAAATTQEVASAAPVAAAQRRKIAGTPSHILNPETGADEDQRQKERNMMSKGWMIPGDSIPTGILHGIGIMGKALYDVFTGEKEYNFELPEIGDSRHNEAYLNDLAEYHGVSKEVMEDMRIYQDMGFGNTFHLGPRTGTAKLGMPAGERHERGDRFSDVTPTEGHTVGGYNSKTGKYDLYTGHIPGSGVGVATAEDFWRDWGAGASWSIGLDDLKPDIVTEPMAHWKRQQQAQDSEDPVDKPGSGATSTTSGGRTSAEMEGGAGGGWSSDTVDTAYSPEADYGDTGGGGEFGGGDSSVWASGGQIGMQEGGMAPPMPQQGAPEDMANLGMVNEQAVQPQQGGQKSVKDDVPREADEGDYILPYETVLMLGLKQLNRYAREAIKLAMKNNIDLGGTDLDPTDDVPIKVSNYEYHIPKILVPFFGGGKKYLDKIREEGLALRKRLEEEKQPSAQAQQAQPAAQPAPPQMVPAAPAAPPQAALTPMMQKGGFVLNPNEQQQQQTPTTAAILERDTSQPTQESAAYNQLQALQRAKKTQQQPLMVDPTGKVIPQGFAAPQGYQMGSMVENPEVAQAAEPKTEPTMPDWVNRMLDPKTPVLIDEETGQAQTVFSASRRYEGKNPELEGKELLYPTIRMGAKGKLQRYEAETPDKADDLAYADALKKGDYMIFNTPEEATEFSIKISKQSEMLRQTQEQRVPINQVPEEQGFALPPAPPPQQMAAI